MSLLPGVRIGNYEVLAPLGAGGMGEVYRARDTRLEREVAIKSLPPAFALDGPRQARFEREARLLAALAHPNIAGIHGLEEREGCPYLILELVEGETLAQRLARGPLSPRETVAVGQQIAAATEAAHGRGIVHRDLKPGNVMITPARTVKVLDFGLAKGEEPPAAGAPGGWPGTATRHVTAEGALLGTAPYMSPEQARGLPADGRSDLWALGCILFECLSGRPAFSGDTTTDVLARILEREPEWPALPESAPERLRELVRACLAKDPAQRPARVEQVRGELDAIAQEIASGRAAPAAPAVPSLAVLYFENMGNDPENEYFCAGITEDILTDLSKIRGMRVASRNAVARYRGAPAEIAHVGRELGVGAVLEGSVRKSGNRVRITAQLIKVADGFHLWAERYDRTLEDVFAVQDDIAHSIADALRVALTPREAEELAGDRPQDVRAYDLYLKGRKEYGQYTPESIHAALDLFRRALAIDPEYALAWAGVADCYGQMLQRELDPDEAGLARLGLEAARRASALNPRLAEAYKAEALVLRFSGDPASSRAVLIKALEANPRFAPALINLAVDFFSNCHLAGTERLIRRVLELDPQEALASWWIGVLLLLTGRYEEALALADRLRQTSDGIMYVTASHIYRIQALLELGDLAGAKAALVRGRGEGARADGMRAMEAGIALREGHLAEARRALDDVGAEPQLGSFPLQVLAETALRAGEPERALALLNRQIVRDLAPCLVRLSPGLHPLLEREPFAPRRIDQALVWPLEAPMIDAARHALFREVRIESGLPQGSDLFW